MDRSFGFKTFSSLPRCSHRLKTAHGIPSVRSSMHCQRVIKRRIERTIEERHKILSLDQKKKQLYWEKKINLFRHKQYSPSGRKRILINGLDKLDVKTNDILNVGVEDFDILQGYSSLMRNKSTEHIETASQQALINRYIISVSNSKKLI